MADFRKMNPEQLVIFLTALATAIANGKVVGFLAAQNTSISDAITDITAVLAAQNLAFAEAEDAFNEIREQRSATVASAQALASDTKLGMHSVNSPGSEFEACGFDAPVTSRSAVVPQTPTDLSATGFSNGVNVARWTSHNRSGSVLFVLECKIGDTADYAQVGATRSQTFRHLGVTPGQFYQYRVRAEAARGAFSEWSNLAVVYGV